MNDVCCVPMEIAPVVAAMMKRAAPKAISLFGSRARGDSDSDWDLAVAVEDSASPDLLDPSTCWILQKAAGVQATIIPVAFSDIAECWGQPNILGYDLARDGRQLDVHP